ncbi:GNAT family N-acetyltransferase [Yinghuangia soli]|uniref:GNAT family N-acetyltransferase n=1 Tax=Yinghuangia soli TaxID=2908204 RepID=A0AA41U0Z4_9ACTN|nr:GNAT family N-acetyltransferase [Yinghuangia soli]MCF2526952.1 GNAT family N-acetyltransferase [Yinghuangia soli]
MRALGSVDWPPGVMRTGRLVLREPAAGDRAAVVELFTSAEVGTYIGGPREREEFERSVPAVPVGRPGLFVVDLGGAMIGMVTVDERGPGRPVRARHEGPEVELGYMLLPQAWGHGYTAEACAAVLDWCAQALPGAPVVLTTQTANERSMRLAAKLGFAEVRRYEEWGAEQWFGVWSAPAAKTGAGAGRD